MATNQENYPEMPRIRVKPPTPATSTTTTTTTTGASPRVTVSTPTATATGAAAETPTAGAARKIAIAVDLSDESAFAVKWAVHHYLRPGDAVVLLHVRPTSVLYGADWGSVDFDTTNIGTNNNDKDKGDGSAVNVENENEIDDVKDKKEKESKQKLEDDFDAFTSSKASDLAQPLIQAQVPYKIHIVKDHDMKERLCLEVERHGFNAVIMGSRGFGASKRGSNGRLGSVSDYCVRHCVCPVVVVRYPDEKDVNDGDDAMVTVAEADEVAAEDEEEYHDASDERKATA